MIEFDPYHGNPNTAFMAVPYESRWTGMFSGESKDYGLAVAHDSHPMMFLDAVSFNSVKVGGLSGGLQIDVMGNRPAVGDDWRGTWVITSGSGELADLWGHGTFWGPGWLGDPEEYGVIIYAVTEMGGIDFDDKDQGVI
jgi:hypothetical protein